MSWFRRKMPIGAPTDERSDIDHSERRAGEKRAGSPLSSRRHLCPEMPRAIDAEFCWGDDRKR